jgi:hypothetical protein
MPPALRSRLSPPIRQGLQTEVLPRTLCVGDDKDLGNVIKTALAGRAEVVTACTLEAAENL